MDNVTHSQFHILAKRRFLPLFVTQALGAFNDNAFKNALVVLITYGIAEKAGIDGKLFVTIAAGLFILPFFLFSATAGQIADKFEKSRLIRVMKLAEIALMALAAVGFYLGDVYWLLSVLFLMGAQSTFFGPLKLSILPQHLREEELIGGNALIETRTFLSILLGTLLGGLLIATDSGAGLVSAITIGLAIAGYLASLFIPSAEAPSPGLRISANFAAETLRILRHAAGRRDVFLSILGISWFWLIGAVFLAQFPSYAKDTLQADEQVSSFFIALFSVGVGIGSLLCNRLLKGEVSAKYVPLGAIGMTIFCTDLYFQSQFAASGSGLIGLAEFVAVSANWQIIADLIAIAICGGLYIVPLYAIVQSRSDAEHRSRTIAANNVMNALFMVVAAAGTVGMLALDFTIPDVFLTVAILNAAAAAYICKLLPAEVPKAIARLLLRCLFRADIKGWENYRNAGSRVVIIANHTSFLDAVLLGAFLPDKVTFAVNTFVARKWWIKPAFLFFDLLPLDPTNPMAAKTMVRAVAEGRKCMIFPEGRLTVTGALMKVYEGPGTIAHLADAKVLPVRIDGAQYSHFSRMRGKVRLRWFPKITVTILAPRKFDVPEDVKGRRRRQIIGAKLYGVMTDMVFQTSNIDRTLFDALLEARATHGKSFRAIEDFERHPMTYQKLVVSSFVLGRHLARQTNHGEIVGVLLPNAVGTAVAFFALHAFGRVPAMLNFSTGSANMVAACAAGQVKTVLTSRKFVETAGLGDTVALLGRTARIEYLEDIRTQLGLFDKIWGVVMGRFPRTAYRYTSGGASPDDAAVVLFTSGSEGVPKGVVLSHANIQANRYQLSAKVDFNSTDIVFNALPVFHSFGLTGGLMLPLLSGLKTFLYPSPLHYRIVPELVYDTNATILFGTDTFLSGYARSAHPYDFYSVRYIFAGAERLKPETRQTWVDKFGIRIYEGYGATETAPVLATNTPMQYSAGTVGQLLPGIEHRLIDVPGIDRGARLEVRGPNVMKGYLRTEAPGELDPPTDGWYDTGDIVEIDDDGYVTIVGRAKRFAKIAGEMISLPAVEAHASSLWPDYGHAVVSIPDPRKGEQLVLVTEDPKANRPELLQAGLHKGLSELAIPKTVLAIERLPVLGTGKLDYVSILQLATAKVSA